MKPPFPWFGGKSRAASEIWTRFGNVPNYVEPFAGSLAVLLNRPHAPKVETVNDKDAYLANFWRATALDPIGVAEHADWPVNEADLHARHKWLLAQSDFRERMTTDPDYYDVKVAGWWVWGICQWIGSGWCSEDYYNGGEWQQRPHLGNPGMGVHRPSQQLPHLGNPGMGVHRPSHQLPHLGDPGMGVHRPSENVDLYDYFAYLSNRLRGVRVCCGDWTRVLGDSPTIKLGITGILLDPPYSAEAERDNGLYGVDDDTIAHDVREWAIKHGDNPLLRIALCGYESEYDMPDDWSIYRWKANGGYGLQGNGAGRENSIRECIWFSRHCLPPQQERLL